MLAWNIRDGHTIAIPRSGRAEHTLLNAQADQIQLTEEDYNAIDQAYPPPVPGKSIWIYSKISH